MLNRLIYKSKSTNFDQEIFSDILVKSIENNIGNNITGMLLKLDNDWLQVLEGENDELNLVYQKISLDDRHSDIRIISFSAIDQRAFSNWSMKGIDIEVIDDNLKKELKDKYFKNSKIQISEDAEINLNMMKDIYNFFNRTS